MYRPAIFAQGTAQVLLVVLVLSLPVSPVDSSERKPDIDDFERNHPVNLEFGVSYTWLNLSWVLVNHADQDDLANFIVFYYKSVERKVLPHHSVFVPSNQTNILITGIEPGTNYTFYVVANYSTGHMPYSYHYRQKTFGVAQQDCKCNRTGSRNRTCDGRTGQCICVDKYTVGKKCDSCIKTYVWVPRVGCQTCDCNKKRSLGTCSIDSVGVVCDCIENFGGKNCDFCAPNYYGESACKPCHCNNNTDPKAPRGCHMKTGKCINCVYNTTGIECQRCMLGYEGDPIKAKNCTKYEDLFAPPPLGLSHHPHHIGIIVGVCVALFIAIVVILAIVLYCKRWQWGQKPLQFWTVELKDDRERVSFSSLPNNPDHQQVEAALMNNDAQIYDRDKPRSQDNVRSSSKSRTKAAGDGSSNPYKILQ